MEERRVSLTEFYTADEVFTMEPWAVWRTWWKSMTARASAAGPVTERLQDIYRTQSWEQAVPLRWWRRFLLPAPFGTVLIGHGQYDQTDAGQS